MCDVSNRLIIKHAYNITLPTIPGGFNNTQCLRCHAGARDFDGNPVHQAIMDLIVVGLCFEIISLLWFHPLSFALFAFAAATLVGLGVLVFLASLVFAVAPSPRPKSGV